MTAPFVADAEALLAWFTDAQVKQPSTWTAELLASGVVQPREDAVREAQVTLTSLAAEIDYGRDGQPLTETDAHLDRWLTTIRTALAPTGATIQGEAGAS